MTDCDGNELAVGDVVEVVKKPGVTHVVLRRDIYNTLAIARETDGWKQWKKPASLRLVRRKEMR